MPIKRRPKDVDPSVIAAFAAEVEQQPTPKAVPPPLLEPEPKKALPKPAERSQPMPRVQMAKPASAGVKRTTVDFPIELLGEFKLLTMVNGTTMREVLVDAAEKWVGRHRFER